MMEIAADPLGNNVLTAATLSNECKADLSLGRHLVEVMLYEHVASVTADYDSLIFRVCLMNNTIR